jgi:hypothetical protein
MSKISHPVFVEATIIDRNEEEKRWAVARSFGDIPTNQLGWGCSITKSDDCGIFLKLKQISQSEIEKIGLENLENSIKNVKNGISLCCIIVR